MVLQQHVLQKLTISEDTARRAFESAEHRRRWQIVDAAAAFVYKLQTSQRAGRHAYRVADDDSGNMH